MNIPNKKYYLTILLLILANALGMTCDIFNGDSALYASISRNIASSGDYIHLNSIILENWIDKPHFGFWIWATFIKTFGNTNVGFKLPTFLSFLLLLRYTYLISRQFYTEKIALTTVIILAGSTHILISTNDVRIDIFLITFMMGALFHYMKYIYENKLIHIFIGSILTSFAIMSKGIFVDIPITIGTIVLLYQHSKFKGINYSLWAICILTSWIGVIPELYVLKIQFQTYNENLILGQKASNYLQFFFWDSQFGRFNSNLGQLQANGDKSFFLHTLAWAFLPWTILVLKSYFIKKYTFKEHLAISCFTVLFLILSFSKTQLSHHSLILLPFLSIILATILAQSNVKKGYKLIKYIHYFLLIVMPIISIGVFYYFTNEISHLLILVSIVYFTTLYILRNQNVCITTSLTAIFIGVFLNLFFYPVLLKYQSGHEAASFANKKNIKSVYNFNANLSLFNYYYDGELIKLEHEQILEIKDKNNAILYTNDYGIGVLKENNISYQKIKSFDDYRTTVLTPQFMNPKTRQKVLNSIYLLKILKKEPSI